MDDHAIIPESDGARRPFPTHGQIIGGVKVFAQEGERVCGFLTLEFGQVRDEDGVVI